MRHSSRFFLTLALVTTLFAAAAPRAEAGKLWQRFKRSPAAVGVAAGFGTAALLNPVATFGALGAGLGFGVGATGHVLAGTGSALLAASAVTPAAGLIFAGATVYAGVKGTQWAIRKFKAAKASWGESPLRANLVPSY